MPYYRRNLYVLSLTVFLATLSWNQVMPFLPKFIKQIGGAQNLDYWVGVVFAMQSLAAILMQPLWGKLGDSYGRKPMIIRAGICLAGVYFGMSICRAPWQLAICRFLNGALTGFIPGSMALIATNTPEQHAPRYIATVQTTSNVGLIIGPMVGAVLAMRFGYRGSMVVSGTAVMLSTMLVWLLVQEPNKVSAVEKTSLIEDFGIALASRVQRSVLLVVMLAWMYPAAVNAYLILHLETLGGCRPDWFPGIIFALPAAAFVLMAYQWTRVGEWWGYDKTIAVGLISGGIGGLTLYVVHNIWLFAVIYFVMSIFTASIGPSVAAVTCTRVDESFRGRAYGIQQSAGTTGSLLAYIVASLTAARWGYGAIFLLTGGMLLVGGLMFRGMARRWEKRPIA